MHWASNPHPTMDNLGSLLGIIDNKKGNIWIARGGLLQGAFARAHEV